MYIFVNLKCGHCVTVPFNHSYLQLIRHISTVHPNCSLLSFMHSVVANLSSTHFSFRLFTHTCRCHSSTHLFINPSINPSVIHSSHIPVLSPYFSSVSPFINSSTHLSIQSTIKLNYHQSTYIQETIVPSIFQLEMPQDRVQWRLWHNLS
jgi:hypothetical protein